MKEGPTSPRHPFKRPKLGVKKIENEQPKITKLTSKFRPKEFTTKYS